MPCKTLGYIGTPRNVVSSILGKESKLRMLQISSWTSPPQCRALKLVPAISSWVWVKATLQDEKPVIAVAAKVYLQRLSVIWTSPLPDANRVKATNQFALPVLTYLMWTQHWPLTELREIDREKMAVGIPSAPLLCSTFQEWQVGAAWSLLSKNISWVKSRQP